MIQSTSPYKHTHNSRGFTLIELLVVTVLIGLLLSSGIYFVDISEKRKSVELSSVQISMLRNFPSAILRVYQSKLTLAGLTASNLTATNEVVQNKPVVWAISGTPTQNEAAIIFTLADSQQASDVETFLNNSLGTTLVNAAAVDSGDNTKVIVTYSI